MLMENKRFQLFQARTIFISWMFSFRQRRSLGFVQTILLRQNANEVEPDPHRSKARASYRQLPWSCVTVPVYVNGVKRKLL